MVANYHVVKFRTTQWSVRRAGAERAYRRGLDKDAAIQLAIHLAEGGMVYVHDDTGRVAERIDTYEDMK